MATKEVILFRPAKLEDRIAVLNIVSGLFSGMDYMSTQYNIILQNKQSFCGVAYLGERIIAFAVLRVSFIIKYEFVCVLHKCLK